MLWRQYAFRGYLLLQQVDERLLEPRLPPAIFYNLLLTARRRRGARRPLDWRGRCPKAPSRESFRCSPSGSWRCPES